MSWCSSETYGGRMVACLLIHIAIALSGLTFGTASLMLKFARIAHGSASTYYKYQSTIAKVVGYDNVLKTSDKYTFPAYQ